MFCKKHNNLPESPIKCIAIQIKQVDFFDNMWYHLNKENAIQHKREVIDIMIMRLVEWTNDSSRLAVLFKDGSMQEFHVEENAIVDNAMTDFLTRYRAPDELKAAGDDKWSDNPSEDDMSEWGGDKVKTAAYIVMDNAYGNEDGYLLIIVDPTPIQCWMQHAVVSIKETGVKQKADDDNTAYITLQEFYEELKNASIDVTMSGIRTKVARHQIPGAIKLGSVWYVPRGSSWPADRRYKTAKKN